MAAVASRKERREYGKSLRSKVPRSSHASWKLPKDRPDPIDLLIRGDAHRLSRLLPIRYGRMALSPFHFLRGAAAVMAHDLSSTPITGLRAQLGGDAHLSNFGIFATPERNLVFDMNDFDETLPGPWEWDVKRLTTSIILAGRFRAFPPGLVERSARLAVRAYRQAMQNYASMRFLDLWYSRIDVAPAAGTLRRWSARLLQGEEAAARRRTGLHVFPRLTTPSRGHYRIRDDPPLIIHFRNSADAEASRAFFSDYLRTLPPERRALVERYHVEDVAQKVVGVGSVGTVCSIVLLMGDKDVEDPLLLQVKEADASVLEPYAGASPFSNHAQRVVTGQHLIQQASDIFLGWSSLRGRDFYVRQLRDMKMCTDLTEVGPKALKGQAELCGAALAHAHARTSYSSAISGYLGSGSAFDEAVVRFAKAYAEQSERDHALLLRAIRSGRLPARPDV